MAPKIPAFDDLTLDPKGPKGNAWGLFGKDNDLGMLNLLTPEVVAEAAKEIKEGVRVSLNWDLSKPGRPFFNRQPFKVDLINKAPRPVNDDVLTFNTQCSTQWDGFRHFGHPTMKVFYNGKTQKDLETTDALGMDGWLKVGGIASRGVLLDWADWCSRNGKTYDNFESSEIPLEDLKAIAKEIGVTFRSGDILFVRSGFIKAYDALTEADLAKIAAKPTFDLLGVQSGEPTVRWLWENQFSAVAGDAPAFERAPVLGPHIDHDCVLHPWLLAGWGMPIGEMFDLEALSAQCKKSGRYTFFVTSAPLNVPSGVASPPNALAFF